MFYMQMVFLVCAKTFEKLRWLMNIPLYRSDQRISVGSFLTFVFTLFFLYYVLDFLLELGT